MPTVCYGFATSPFGLCFLAWNEASMLRMEFLEPDGLWAQVKQLRDAFPTARLLWDDVAASTEAIPLFLSPTCRELPALGSVQAPLWQHAVWAAAAAIPVGECRTYAELAAWLDNAFTAEEVHQALRNNPLGWLIPCHRAENAAGEATAFRWPRHLRGAMLERERHWAQLSPDPLPTVMQA